MPASQVENLGKSTHVGHNNALAERYTALRDVLARKTRDRLTGREGRTPATASFRLGRRNPAPWTVARSRHNGLLQTRCQGDAVEAFWALQDITTKSSLGDRVGIILFFLSLGIRQFRKMEKRFADSI